MGGTEKLGLCRTVLPWASDLMELEDVLNCGKKKIKINKLLTIMVAAQLCSNVNHHIHYENTLFLGTVTRCSENQLGFTI